MQSRAICFSEKRSTQCTIVQQQNVSNKFEVYIEKRHVI